MSNRSKPIHIRKVLCKNLLMKKTILKYWCKEQSSQTRMADFDQFSPKNANIWTTVKKWQQYPFSSVNYYNGIPHFQRISYEQGVQD